MKYKTQNTRRQSGAVGLAIYNASEALKLRFATSPSLFCTAARRSAFNQTQTLSEEEKIGDLF